MEYNQVRVGAVNVPRDFNCEVCDFCKNGHCLLFDSLQDCKKAKLKDRRFNVGDIVYTNVCRCCYRDSGGYRWIIVKLKIKELIYQSKKTIRYVCTNEDFCGASIKVVDGKVCTVLGDDGLTQDFELVKRDNVVLNSLEPRNSDVYKNIKTKSVIVW
jgi:hypothetical protein